jgi:cystathionine beta-lyase/cystathionine gamma-synthase
MIDTTRHRIDTRLIHAGEPDEGICGSVAMPIFQTSTFEYGGTGGYHDLRYTRLSNTPNHLALHEKLASLEGGEAALVTASGMAAISTTLLALLRTGDHLLVQACVYGGTHDLLTRDLTDFGIEHTFINGDDPSSWAAALRPNTRVVYAESIANPVMDVADLPAIAAFAREHGLVSVIDNTFATPINFRPIEHGFDIVVHSATKYLNGHNDVIAGAVIGPETLIERVRHRLNHLGAALEPHACFLLHRGLKTLALRVRHQNASALEIARFLEGHPAVERVNYPGLPSHRSHQQAAALFSGFGGMLSFELHGGADAATTFIARTTLPYDAPSLGGTETLLTRPAQTSHVGLDAEERRALGISDGMVRLSVGLEATEDLIADFDRALQACLRQNTGPSPALAG